MLPNLGSRPSARLSGLSQSVRWGRLGVTATILCLSLAGCEVFGSEEPEPQRVATATTEGQEPNLGDVPSEAPQTSSQTARQEVREGLLADRSQARYTDETLTGEGLVGAAPGLTDPSAPATARAAPSAPPFASLDSQNSAQSAARQSYQLGGSQAATRSAAAATGAQAAASTASQTQSTQTQSAQTQAAQTQAAQTQTVPTQQQQRQATATTTQRQALPQARPPTTQQAQAATRTAPRQAASIPSPAPPPTPSLPPLPPGPPVLLGVIYFNHNSTALSQGDLQVLRQVVALQQQRGGVLRVVGHASQRTAQLDPRAHEQANLQLSQRRADSVARALRGFGVRPDSVISEGRGDSEQLYHEFMPTGEAGNRRVEIFLQS